MRNNLSRREFLVASAAVGATLASQIFVGQEKAQTEIRGVMEKREEDEWQEAIKELRQSVVGVYGPKGHGSGFCVAPGFILTCEHVTHENNFGVNTSPVLTPFALPVPPLPLTGIDDPNFEIALPTTDDREPGKRFKANFAHTKDGKRCTHKDIALLQLPLDAPQIKPVKWGTAGIGERVITIGDPHDQTSLVGTGRVSKEVLLANTFPTWEGVPMIGTDAPINSGNSGGLMASFGKEGTRAIGISAYGYNLQGLSGGIRADYAAFIATTLWGLPLMTKEQVAQYKKDFPSIQ